MYVVPHYIFAIVSVDFCRCGIVTRGMLPTCEVRRHGTASRIPTISERDISSLALLADLVPKYRVCTVHLRVAVECFSSIYI